MNNTSGWKEKYAPKTLNEVVGHIYAKRELTKRLAEGNFRQNLLFSGSSGVGKTLISKIIAKTLSCKSPVTDTYDGVEFPSPCNECVTCKSVDNDENESSFLAYDGAKLGKDGLNELREECERESIFSKKKIIFIDEIQNIGSGRDATMQTLLKIIEKDYQGKVYFIMSTMDIKKINRAVVDRFHSHFKLKEARIDDLIQHGGMILGKEGLLDQVDFENLKSEGIDLFIQEGLPMIAGSANGSVRKFVNDLETCIYRELFSEKEIVEELEILSPTTTFSMMKLLVNKDKSFLQEIKKVEGSLSEFFSLSHSILVDLSTYLLTGEVRFEWQRGSFKQLENEENVNHLLSIYNAIYEGQTNYFNDNFFRGKLINYLMRPSTYKYANSTIPNSPSVTEDDKVLSEPPKTRTRTRVRG